MDCNGELDEEWSVMESLSRGECNKLQEREEVSKLLLQVFRREK